MLPKSRCVLDLILSVAAVCAHMGILGVGL